MNSTFENSSPKHKRSVSPIKTQIDYQPPTKKSMILNESELDSKMQHWEEYKIKGVKIPRKSYHSASFYQTSLYIYGGYEINLGNLDDFMRVDLGPNVYSYEWEEVSVKSQIKPGPRSRHTTVVYKDKMYLYGGQVSAIENTNKLIAYDFLTEEWSHIEPKGQNLLPSIDSHAALLWDRGNGKTSMLVVGGFMAGPEGGYSNGVYEYDFAENQSRVLFKNKEVDADHASKSSIPQGRMGLGAAIYNNILYMFGGNEGNTKLNDLWKFDLLEKKWGRVKTAGATIPEPRSGHSLVCYRDILIVFGGILDITQEKNDIYLFAIQKGSWLAVEKETKWVFEETNRQSTSPEPKSPLKKIGTLDLDAPARSPPKQNSISPKKFLIKDQSLDSSGDTSPSSTIKAQNAQSKSPTNMGKYGKIRLLENAPKGGAPLNETLKTMEDDSPSPTSKLKSNMEEKQKRDRLLKKTMLLKEFEVSEDKMDKIKADLTVTTPVLEAMQKSIKSLAIDKSKEKPDSTLATTMVGLDAIRAYADKSIDDGNPVKVGVKPVARDGHSATMLGDKMYIFGGDRHKMSFNDLFALNLKFLDSVGL